MNLISVLYGQMERSSAGSAGTTEQVLRMCGGCKSALYIGDEAVTPLAMKARGMSVRAAFSELPRAEAARAAGIDAVSVQRFELPDDAADYDLLWYGGAVEFDSVAQRLRQLKDACRKGGIVVYRTLCWLIDPSPDTRTFVTRRFGAVQPLDTVLRTARETGFGVQDFYISPRTDWTTEFYSKLMNAAKAYADDHGEDTVYTAGIGELQKEADMFELHSEEYSYVYYILKG